MKASRMWEFWFWIPPGWEKPRTSVFCWSAKCSCHETIMQAIITSSLSCGCLFTKSDLCSVRCLLSAEGSVADVVNPNCGPDSHASVPVWCKNAEVQLCLLCHVALSTPRGNYLASCRIAMTPAESMRRDSNQQETIQARHLILLRQTDEMQDPGSTSRTVQFLL